MFDPDGDGPASPQKRYRAKNPDAKGDVRGQNRRRIARKTAERRRDIAVLDLETNPFNNVTQDRILPFLAILYSDQFEPVIMWNEDWRELVREIVQAIEALPRKFTIYAHNGGRFDYLYLIHTIRGQVSFKGRAIMRANIGGHEIRDSLHIIPESLKNANKKEEIDYSWFAPDKRNDHRSAIIAYCLSDCEYTFDVVRAFIERFGLPITIGQASFSRLKKLYPQIERLGNHTDAYLRQFFQGGRTECLSSPAVYEGAFRLYDVHSMYPSVMALLRHPIGNEFYVNDVVTAKTAFVHLRCTNRGALLSEAADGSLTSAVGHGEFRCSIWEYRTARELNLIKDVVIIKTIDFYKWSDFADFVLPLYNERQALKLAVKSMTDGPEKKRAEQDIKFFKYLLNNAYGKFAQNPRRFKEFYLTDPGDVPPEKWLYFGCEAEYEQLKFEPRELDQSVATLDQVKLWRTLPEIENEHYWIWSHRCPEFRFNNVATAASITGAARAKLLHAIHNAVDPLYCDTDSLVCRDLRNVVVTDSELGTWNLEKHISTFILTGKKQYAYRECNADGSPKLDKKTGKQVETIRSKGMKGVTWQDMENIVRGHSVTKTMPAPTIGKDQTQKYITRELKITAPRVTLRRGNAGLFASTGQ